MRLNVENKSLIDEISDLIFDIKKHYSSLNLDIYLNIKGIDKKSKNYDNILANRFFGLCRDSVTDFDLCLIFLPYAFKRIAFEFEEHGPDDIRDLLHFIEINNNKLLNISLSFKVITILFHCFDNIITVNIHDEYDYHYNFNYIPYFIELLYKSLLFQYFAESFIRDLSQRNDLISAIIVCEIYRCYYLFARITAGYTMSPYERELKSMVPNNVLLNKLEILRKYSNDESISPGLQSAIILLLEDYEDKGGWPWEDAGGTQCR